MGLYKEEVDRLEAEQEVMKAQMKLQSHILDDDGDPTREWTWD